jgi:hypothetical protein
MSFKEFLNEAKYEIYHSSFSAAVQEAESFAEQSGYTLDDEEMAEKIGFGPSKPKNGKTNKYTITLYKKEKEQKKALQIQVYNRGTDDKEFELNVYIS